MALLVFSSYSCSWAAIAAAAATPIEHEDALRRLDLGCTLGVEDVIFCVNHLSRVDKVGRNWELGEIYIQKVS